MAGGLHGQAGRGRCVSAPVHLHGHATFTAGRLDERQDDGGKLAQGPVCFEIASVFLFLMCCARVVNTLESNRPDQPRSNARGTRKPCNVSEDTVLH